MAQRPPIDVLWQTVMAQDGPAREWHISNLYHHQRRYQEDLRLVAALASGGTVLDLGWAPAT